MISTNVNPGKFYSQFCFCLLALAMACSSDDDPVAPPDVHDPLIETFEPAQGILGNTVVINGSHFSATALDNVVQFNGIPALVQSATANKLTVVVPDSATTGKIKVTVAGRATESNNSFNVLTPVIESVNPFIASPGLSLIIEGQNFSPAKTSNKVTIGGKVAEVLSAAEDQLEVRVAEGSVTSKVVVQVGTQKAMTATAMQICDGSPEIIITDVEITSTNAEMNSLTFTYTLTNVGNADIDMKNMLMQNYLSKNDVYDIGDLAAGGWILTSLGVLSQGESYTSTWTSGADYSEHKILLITLRALDGSGVNECNTDNNILAKVIE